MVYLLTNYDRKEGLDSKVIYWVEIISKLSAKGEENEKSNNIVEGNGDSCYNNSSMYADWKCTKLSGS